MRKPLIAGNWKMNMGGSDSKELSRSIRNALDDYTDIDILLCPPYTAITHVYEIIKNTSIILGAQNCFYESKGAFTGEISPLFLLDIGCKYVILGHSERRYYFGETADLIGKKMICSLDSGLNIILCVGEKLEERENGEAFEIVKSQLEGSFRNLPEDYLKKITVAYEPVWAIGTGKTCEPNMAEEMHHFIRSWFKVKFGDIISNNLRILYGGSIKPENISSLIVKEDIDGGLIGGASLNVDSFIQIIKNTIKAVH
ncbi:triose-phosphate isomerase [candidate division WOR-3 bacterium]|nr:triose-phosphate isomerase [candidate division WOR-3 bacterium]